MTLAASSTAMMAQMTVSGPGHLNDPKNEAKMKQDYLDFDAPFSIQYPDNPNK